MQKRIIMFAAALAAGFVLIGAARDEVSTFPLYVNVEQDGKPVTGLSASNFRVFLDGRGQEFALQEPEALVSVVVLAENAPRSRPYWADIEAAVKAVAEYGPPQWWYGLVTFDRETHINKDFTRGGRSIPAALSGVIEPAAADVATFDAILDTLDMMSPLSGRRVLIFIGSGLDSFSIHSFGDVEKRLESANTIFFSVNTGSANGSAGPVGPSGVLSPYPGAFPEVAFLQARSFLETLAGNTGGEAWFPLVAPAYSKAAEKLFTDLLTQYKLVVRAGIPGDGRLHKVKVDAFTITNDRRRDFKVRVRDGYRQPPAS